MNESSEVPPGCIKTYKNKSIPDATKLYVLQENKSACLFFSLLYAFYFIDDKIAVYWFKDEITPSLKTNDRLNFSQYVSLNCVREKGKLRLKLLYEVLKEDNGYTTLIVISPYPIFIQLKDYLGGIRHCVAVVGK